MPKKSTTTWSDDDLLEKITHIVIDRLREEETTLAKKKYDTRLANTRLLLRNYRSLVDHCESAIYDMSQVDANLTLKEFLEIMAGKRGGGFKIESIKTSAARTRIIIEHIDTMIDLYKMYCDTSPQKEDARRYRVIYYLYLAEEPKTHAELAAEEYVDKRTIYRDVDMAVERLTALIFGIDGLSPPKK